MSESTDQCDLESSRARPTDSDLRESLERLLTGRVCVVGVGNRQRGDDGAGPAVIERRAPRASGVWLDAGNAPENHLESIVRAAPDTVLLVDAAAFDGVPGELRLFDPDVTDGLSVSTHAGSLNLLARYLAARTGASVHVMAIQPAAIPLEAGLSSAVEDSVATLAETLSEILSAQTSGRSGTDCANLSHSTKG